ncbi:DUF2058 family protein [Acidihalobacter ferrooxydans]|uniref:Nucleoprotein/polynucleotide-associated enzyme n=1 Tax=Acidihalobacter ferrooxydans TaxID=1765967 RepID=A0A1P8UK52_9GAMM|nr:DUF2058 family protein [Acidihalobacter ferrooxydans]APZ44152.1 hypothetical protein BW247_14495 [Acidihalobacter ferrooxydans]
MSNDLRDQLLKAGLVTEAQVKKAETPRPPRESAKARQPAPTRARKAKPQQLADGRANKGRRKPAQVAQTPSPTPHLDKAQREAVRVFLRERRRNVADAPLPYNFLDGSAVKKLWVTAEQHTALGAGTLLIVARNDRHYLIGDEDVQKLLELDPRANIIRAQASATVDEDPAYRDHPIPDDLMW